MSLEPFVNTVFVHPEQIQKLSLMTHTANQIK